jgi:uncharacterized protein
MLLGTLAAVRRYPVKSLRGEALDCVDVAAAGIPGDRACALVVRAGHARVGKTFRGKEHDRLHLLAGAPAGSAAAAQEGVDVEVCRGEHFFDDAPISILVDRWLDDLSEHVGYTVEWERFRPNFFVHAGNGFALTEADLVDAVLALGSVKLRVRAPIERCVTVTYHPRGEDNDPRILAFLAAQRETLMGIYCDVGQPGIASVGDSLVRL